MIKHSQKPLDAVPLVVYIAESDGICRVLTFSEREIRDGGGVAALEAMLAVNYDWSESLGTIQAIATNGRISYSGRNIEGLVLRSSRRMAPLASVCELQYAPIDSLTSRNN